MYLTKRVHANSTNENPRGVYVEQTINKNTYTAPSESSPNILHTEGTIMHDLFYKNIHTWFLPYMYTIYTGFGLWRGGAVV